MSSKLKDFLSKQPIDVIVGTEITPTKVLLPIKVDVESFFKNFSADIETDTHSTEKSIYVGATHQTTDYKTASFLLNSKTKY